jgi:hypothetical protein
MTLFGLKKYSYGPYNKNNETEQWIRITEGCPHHHEYCYEPKEIKVFGIPEIVRNTVKIMDMNLLCKPEALGIIKELGEKRVSGKVVYYELICGVDFRFLTQEIALALHASRFKKIRMAWDFGFNHQRQIRSAIRMLRKAGYTSDGRIQIFMVCNWRIPFEICCQKLDLLKIWHCQVSDCWFDNQLAPNIKPLFWSAEQIKTFRRICRKHNQLINFGIDPQRKDTAEDL